jgi:hypothetical protein
VLFCDWGMGHADGERVDATAQNPRDWCTVLDR